jgi:hypothetical protein
MKQAILWFVLAVMALAILAGIVLSMMWAGRVASDAITTVEVIEPEPGVRCAKMLTTEGAAISCWKVAP